MCPRVAVVLGAGGTVGHAFHAAVLGVLHDVTGWDAGEADLLVGTSAGSVVAALLRAGLPAPDLARRALGRPLSSTGAEIVARAGIAWPTRPGRPRRERSGSRMASPARLARAVQAPWEVRPGSIAAAVMPAGRVATAAIAEPFDALYGETWPVRPLWIAAVELDTGRRVVFGRPGAPTTTPGQAVRASCAVPGYFEPAEIAGHRYVDGAVHSTTNADLVADERPDLVLISAPMSAVGGAVRFGPGFPVRQFARLSLGREVAALRALGSTVVTFQPTADDLAVMGGDSLDPRRFAPVCRQIEMTARRRLEQPGVRERLRVLG
ncbi:MAG: patatin-like phospholipase family protein [Ilumatobacteraceae bacterium]